MKVTILQGYQLPAPPTDGGAVEKKMNALGLSLASRGHHVTHVSRRFPEQERSEVIGGVNHIRVDCKIQHINNHLARDAVYSFYAMKEIPISDIIISNTFWYPVFHNKSFGKLVVHVARIPRFQHVFYTKAAAFQCISNSLFESFQNMYPFLSDKTFIVRNTLTSGFDSTDDIVPPPISLRPKKILYLGRIAAEKGLIELVSGFRLLENRFPEWTLDIVGPADVAHGGDGKSFLSLLTAKIGNSKNINIKDPIYAAQDIRKEYRSARIFVYPTLLSAGETFGVAPLEAMSQGCYTVVSSVPCFRDFIVDDNNGTIFFDHSPEVVSRTLALAMAGSEAEAFQQKCDDAVKAAQSFTMAKRVIEYEELFHKITRECDI